MVRHEYLIQRGIAATDHLARGCDGGRYFHTRAQQCIECDNHRATCPACRTLERTKRGSLTGIVDDYNK